MPQAVFICDPLKTKAAHTAVHAAQGLLPDQHTLREAQRLGIVVAPHRWRAEYVIDFPPGMAAPIKQQFEAELDRYRHEVLELLRG